ncbi:MAG TPA: SPOR domain-containing protein [Acidobacteriaceae bacterium]|nr:SPOR domain-containing protein [Acidobacteriaceae bacterium]
MSRLLDDDQDELQQRDRELTLSTGAILAIFLGLVLLCGVFFGFGYNLGRKSTSTLNPALPVATSDAEPAGTANSTFDNFKPSPNSPSAAQVSSSPTPVPSHTPAVSEKAPAEVPQPQPAPAAPPTHASTPPAATVTRPTNTTPNTPVPPKPTQAAAPAITPGGAFVVQIAAISAAHKDDADLLVNALHTKGYQVSERTATQDNLIRIQVGPFATKADAEAMRERLIVDGYNAIVK